MASKKRFMEAVAEKIGTGKRRPMLKRKGGPTVVIAIGAPKMAPKPAPEMADEDEGEGKPLVCPKCGAELADTPENREYASERQSEMEDESEDEAEDEDED